MSAFTKPVLELVEKGAAKFYGTKFGEVAGRFALESGGHALQRQGQASKMLVSFLEAAADRKAIEKAGFLEKNWKDVEFLGKQFKSGDESFYNQLATGKAASDPATQFLGAKYSDLMTSFRQDVINASAAAGGKPTRIPTMIPGPYFPRKYDSEMYAGKSLDAAAEFMVKTGQAKTKTQARRILGEHRSLDPSLYALHPHIERRRILKLPFEHRKDPGVVFDYILDAVDRKIEIEMFGIRGERLGQLLDAVEAESGVAARKYAETVTSAFLGHHPAAYSSLMERQVVAFEVATKLGTSVLSNMFQPINNTLVVGIKPVLEAVAQRAANPQEFREFGLRSGAAFMQTFADMKRILGAEREMILNKPFRYTGFPRVESWNRVFSANVGRVAAEDALAKLIRNPQNGRARQLLETLGVTDVPAAMQRGALLEQELLTAGKRLSDITQLPQTVLSLPPEWKLNPFVRMATLFKQFAFGQARMVKDHVIKPALRDGNYKPLLYMGVLFPTVGEIAADLKAIARTGTLERRPDWDKYPLDRLVDNMSQAAGFGITMDMFSAITNASPSATHSFLLGPIGSDVAELMALPKYDATVSERYLLGKVPTLGPLLRSALVPPKVKQKGALESGAVTKTVESIFE